MKGDVPQDRARGTILRRVVGVSVPQAALVEVLAARTMHPGGWDEVTALQAFEAPAAAKEQWSGLADVFAKLVALDDPQPMGVRMRGLHSLVQ